MMRNASKRISNCQEQWEEDAKNNRIEVTEDNVADGFNDDWIPNRIAQTESNKLAILPELIESKVIGQKKLF
jgi:ATP-dependent Clp protease ATP-binding subunit ClpC